MILWLGVAQHLQQIGHGVCIIIWLSDQAALSVAVECIVMIRWHVALRRALSFELWDAAALLSITLIRVSWRKEDGRWYQADGNDSSRRILHALRAFGTNPTRTRCPVFLYMSIGGGWQGLGEAENPGDAVGTHAYQHILLPISHALYSVD
jgi:hypothetical protein